MSCDWLTAAVAYEKEFYFFDDFVVDNAGKCGTILTYELVEAGSTTTINPADAVIDQVALVPNKRRILFKDSSTVGQT